ncbi:hypothetical protein OC861_004801 [Tilletia horrida]|nr:hypothetical protein OC845_004804 [Tilletia horrida]KAK0563432.1 hypothetical protein OC861_004801 [Tilletia horrida]
MTKTDPKSPLRRVAAFTRQLSTPASKESEQIGILKLGTDVRIPVFTPQDYSRLPQQRLLLPLQDPIVEEHLAWLGQKWVLNQDIFLLSTPGPYARRLALTFAALLQIPYEIVTLHRDIGESELLQSRNLQAGGSLVYLDGPVTRAMKNGSILILEGIERAERNVLPCLNNILENREVNLADGTQLVPASRIASGSASDSHKLIPVHPNFRIIATSIPVPPYKGASIDPPFRSRFQARWVEGNVAIGHSLPSDNGTDPAATQSPEGKEYSNKLAQRWYEWAGLLKYHAFAAEGGDVLPPTSRLPNLPTTALSLLSELAYTFPPSSAPPSGPAAQTGAGDAETAAQEQDSSASAPTKAKAAQVAAQIVAPSTSALLGSAYPQQYILDDAKRKLHVELLAAVNLQDGLIVPAETAPPGSESEPDRSLGLLGFKVQDITRESANVARITFIQPATGRVSTTRVLCGPLPFLPISQISSFQTQGSTIVPTPRLLSTLTTMLQLHATGRDLCLLPSSFSIGRGSASLSEQKDLLASSQASSSTSTNIALFAALLGFELESVWLWKDVGGNEILMRRATSEDGSTTWEPAPLLRGALQGKLIHLAGVDVLGPTLISLARLHQDREIELWHGGRATLADLTGPSFDSSSSQPSSADIDSSVASEGHLASIHPAFRVIATASTSKTDWLTEEASTLFAFVRPSPMSEEEERDVIQKRTGCGERELDQLFWFAQKYRTTSSDPNLNLSKSRRLGTRQLIRIAQRLAQDPWADIHGLISRNLLVAYLPVTVRNVVLDLLAQCRIHPRGAEGAFQFRPQPFIPAPKVDEQAQVVTFENLNEPKSEPVKIPRFDANKCDPEGVALIPAVPNFYSNTSQNLLLQQICEDLQVLREPVLCLGPQGSGKNRIVDEALRLVGRPREYIQLHRDTTVASLLQQVHLEGGKLSFVDSPLVRAIRTGRVLVVDEADKASAPVVAIFKSLAERGELTLPDGSRVRPLHTPGTDKDIILHSEFRLILLANRPGYPFLGNTLLEVLGEGFSSYAVNNPNHESEVRLLRQAAPDVPEKLIVSLDLAFNELREAFDAGTVTYPYSLRELLHIVKHLQKFPQDDISSVLLNTLSFDLHRPEAMRVVLLTLKKYGIPIDGLSLVALQEQADEARRKAGADGKQKVRQVQFEPKGSTELDQPKEGQATDGKAHVGGNRWRGGTGGRDTGGLGGRGGYERYFVEGHDVHTVSKELKEQVPEHIRKQAREMAREALNKKLSEEGMTSGEGVTYHAWKMEMAAQIQQLTSMLENLQAQAKERQWINRQQEGELDQRRLTDALTGERAIFRRRQEAPPELGAAQTKPKRIRFVLDCSASMYTLQYDGRLDRQVKTCLMVLEAFARADPARFKWDIVGHSGDSASIPLVKMDHLPKNDGQRNKVLRDIVAYTQYCDSGDTTLASIRQSVQEVAKDEADDYFVCALSDANLSRYGIGSASLGQALRTNPKVKTAIIFLDKGQESQVLARQLPGKAFAAADLSKVPQILQDILQSVLDDNA